MKRVLLCGNSLLVSGLQASLENKSGLEIEQINPQEETILERVMRWKPDVLILESALIKEYISFSILNEFPRLRIISVDLDGNRMLVFSGLASERPSTEVLLQMIAA